MTDHLNLPANPSIVAPRRNRSVREAAGETGNGYGYVWRVLPPLRAQSPGRGRLSFVRDALRLQRALRMKGLPNSEIATRNPGKPSPVVYFHERLFAFKAVVGGFRHACIITAAPGFGGFGS